MTEQPVQESRRNEVGRDSEERTRKARQECPLTREDVLRGGGSVATNDELAEDEEHVEPRYQEGEIAGGHHPGHEPRRSLRAVRAHAPTSIVRYVVSRQMFEKSER